MKNIINVLFSKHSVALMDILIFQLLGGVTAGGSVNPQEHMLDVAAFEGFKIFRVEKKDWNCNLSQ